MLKGIKVLVVEDDMTSQEMLCTTLLSKGALCTAAVNGKEGMDVLEYNADLDIVLLDLHMPVMDGFEVLARAKGNPYLSDIPIIVLTTDRKEKLNSLKLGADDFLTKPYNLEELELRIVKLCAARRSTQSANRAKKEFLAMVSQELRVPMHHLVGIADLLAGGNPGSDRRELVAQLKNSTGSMTATIDDILSYVQLDHEAAGATSEHFSLRAATQGALDAQADSARQKGVNLALRIGDEVADRLHGPSSYVQKVFSLLIGNAIKFCSRGEVLVAIREESLGEFGSRFCCSVSDQGPGIPAEFREKIFDPFVQVDRAGGRPYQGIGLGLAIAKRMVELMGGTIEVISGKEGGSSFNFSFQCNLYGTTELL